jgi:hypothetical protein
MTQRVALNSFVNKAQTMEEQQQVRGCGIDKHYFLTEIASLICSSSKDQIAIRISIMLRCSIQLLIGLLKLSYLCSPLKQHGQERAPVGLGTIAAGMQYIQLHNPPCFPEMAPTSHFLAFGIDNIPRSITF